MPVLQAEYLAKGGDAFPVLMHGADGNADPFRQVVAFHRTHDHFALKECAKNRETVANFHQNKIRGAGDERKFHRAKFFLEKGTASVAELFFFTLILFITLLSKRIYTT